MWYVCDRSLFLKHVYRFLGLWSNMNRSSWLSDSLSLHFIQNVHVESAKGEIDAFEEAENELKKTEKDLQLAELVPILAST